MLAGFIAGAVVGAGNCGTEAVGEGTSTGSETVASSAHIPTESFVAAGLEWQKDFVLATPSVGAVLCAQRGNGWRMPTGTELQALQLALNEKWGHQLKGYTLDVFPAESPWIGELRDLAVKGLLAAHWSSDVMECGTPSAPFYCDTMERAIVQTGARYPALLCGSVWMSPFSGGTEKIGGYLSFWGAETCSESRVVRCVRSP